MKVYLVGNQENYLCWINDLIIVNKIKDADVVFFTGGADINPKIYNQNKHRTTSYSENRDYLEMLAFNEAQDLNKVCFGTCRGIQLLSALSGARLIQNMDHPYTHQLYFYDGIFNCSTNSLHHQMVYPFDMNKEDYHILAWAKELSPFYSNEFDGDTQILEKDNEGCLKEPEMLYYPKTKCLGIQGHPEMLKLNSKLVEVCNAFLYFTVENRLEECLKNEASVQDLLDTYFLERKNLIKEKNFYYV